MALNESQSCMDESRELHMTPLSQQMLSKTRAACRHGCVDTAFVKKLHPSLQNKANTYKHIWNSCVNK